MELPFSDNIKDIADSMGVTLYQRFTVAEASLFLRCPITEIRRLQKQGRIDSIIITKTQFEFFGYQLLQYLLNSATHHSPKPNAPTRSVDRIIRAKEVHEMTGLSRTTLWRLEKKDAFPRRISLGGNSVGWKLSEIQNWIRER